MIHCGCSFLKFIKTYKDKYFRRHGDDLHSEMFLLRYTPNDSNSETAEYLCTGNIRQTKRVVNIVVESGPRASRENNRRGGQGVPCNSVHMCSRLL